MTTTAEIVLPDSRELPRKTWTRAEYERLYDKYLRTASTNGGTRYELLEGEIIAVMPQKRRHLVACMRVQALLMAAFGTEFVQSQGPIALDDNNLPEPDVAVLYDAVSDYPNDPSAADVRLLVEVSDTTLRTDLSLKAALYARAGIAEYWIVDVNGRELHVHTQPAANGYEHVVTLGEGEMASPLVAPDAAFLVANLLPPA